MDFSFSDLNFNSVENLPGFEARAAFTVNSASVFREGVDIVPTVVDDSLSYIPWGGDNQMPFDLLALVEKDETLATCQCFNAEVCYGSGLQYCTTEASASVKNEVEDFFLDNDIAAYFLGVCQDFKHFGFAVSVLILNEDGTKIVRLLRKEACYCRFTPTDKRGSISKILSANWRKSISSKEDIEVIRLLDVSNPWSDLKHRLELKDPCRKYAVVSRITTSDSTYYPIPYYASLFKGKWYNIKQLTSSQASLFGETLFPDLAITDQVKGTGSKWERYLALRPMILDIEASLAEEFFSPELMVRLRNEVLRKTHTADLVRVINAIWGQVVDLLNGGSIRMRDMTDVVNHIRCYPDLFPEWHASEIAKLFAPPIFRNEKKASGYFF